MKTLFAFILLSLSFTSFSASTTQEEANRLLGERKYETFGGEECDGHKEAMTESSTDAVNGTSVLDNG